MNEHESEAGMAVARLERDQTRLSSTRENDVAERILAALQLREIGVVDGRMNTARTRF